MMRRLRSSSFASARFSLRLGSSRVSARSRSCVGSFSAIGEIGDRRDGFAIVVGLRLQCDVAAGQARLHFEDFLRLDAEILAIACASLVDSAAERTFIRRRLKKSFRCALVVATLTRRQLRSTYSWISARIQ